jgi:hypothetical protein
MCEAEPTRRRALAILALGGAGALALGGPTVGRPALAASPSDTRTTARTVEVVPGLEIHPRDAWGADLPPTGAIEPDDVAFLLVHHTASANTTTRSTSDPVAVMRSAYAFHTGPSKRWPDVAYHFFVAPDGSVWEGRTGSLSGAYEASATGGNQGWAQLVCLIGNFERTPPTPEAQAALVRVLKWLTWRYGLDPHPSATADYVSRGSDRHPLGTRVTTPVISGHRDATYTACPGDAAYELLPVWREQVARLPDPALPRVRRRRPGRAPGTAVAR